MSYCCQTVVTTFRVIAGPAGDILRPMKLRFIAALALLSCGTPLAAERLQFDYRIYAPLKQVLDSGEKDMVDFNADTPARLVDLIAVRGASARDWTEALEIVSIARPKNLANVRDWLTALQRESLARCPATFTIISHDANSVTYERRSPGCAAEPASLGLYRLVAGKRSWFELAVLAKGELDEKARGEWLAVLASAHLD